MIKTSLYSDRDLDIETYGPLFSVKWKKETTYYHIDLITHFIDQTCEAIEQVWKTPKIAFITVIPNTAKIPDLKISSYLAKKLKDKTLNTAFSMVLFTGKGIRSFLIKNLVAELNYVSKYPYPHQVFGNSEKASDWALNNMNRLLPEWGINKKEIYSFIRSIR